jgi:DNA-binding response OmpR family regulator
MNVQVKPRPTSSPARSGEPVILFVDDEPEILSALRRCFRHEAYVLYTALGPAEGLSWLERASVDLVICDDRMPGMTAAEFLLEARERSPRICRAILTGPPSETLVPSGLEAVAEAVLYKPWDDGWLRESIRGLLRKQASTGSRTAV